ncbi:MAG TPA: ABC transporter substrate-binding protein [Zoogloea sp.]|uniref:MlaC/ttg2D family ABC transporter substrate-binding protein n=1 Tax=Zoogloea sp. TaxID=49181 RepID=UPI002C78D14C|nr:ABC transporter substrate-binding protein [Zoogloea sp.]HMV16890.1 ABC transporter substrate-binding protein [Rhodocyclaceae bacterium]HMV61838.1 ABC transporter substrate-binding protein [Rhodocyclaceae bacterium]HMY49103.1 ABC transporter substrate-binding protein [Rhodocyclaceae bacterium]HMZ77019.1 ABC transporter substrate-binding protein [Rhodocyclaceae bacterium]HNA67761.1 ABC transporter substrate-binding protein [Rhodocyclaceae bacterium]
MIKKTASFLAALTLSLGFQAAAFANAVAPDALVKGVTDDVIAIVRQDKAIQSGDTRRAVELVETKVLPYFDFAHMTRLAVGKDWKSASADQKSALTDEFKTLLVRTYSNALTQYRNQQIDFKPLKAKPEDTDVVVRTEVRQPGAKPVQIDYALDKQGDAWKVYDVMVAGVSLVTNYRDEFGQQIRSGGVDGLIKSLKDKNKQLEAAPKK